MCLLTNWVIYKRNLRLNTAHVWVKKRTQRSISTCHVDLRRLLQTTPCHNSYSNQPFYANIISLVVAHAFEFRENVPGHLVSYCFKSAVIIRQTTFFCWVIPLKSVSECSPFYYYSVFLIYFIHVCMYILYIYCYSYEYRYVSIL